MYAPFSGIAMNTASLASTYSLQEIVDACIHHGFSSVSLHRRDIERIGLSSAARLLISNNIRVSSLSRIGPITLEKRKEIIYNAKLAIEEAQELGAKNLIIIVGPISRKRENISTTLDHAIETISLFLPYAEEAKVQLSVEPLHPFFAATRSCLTTIRDALNMRAQLGSTIGITVDTFHIWWDTNALELINLLAPNSVFAFQVSDWLLETNNPLSDRGMPGEGVVDFFPFMQAVNKNGFFGDIDFEIMSSRWSSMPINAVFHNVKKSSLALMKEWS